MTDLMNDLDGFETHYTDSEYAGDGLLRMSWYNGEAKLKTPGSFFIPARKFEALGITPPTEKPWHAVTRTFESGNSEDGYEAAALKLAIIGVRQQDCVLGQDGTIEQYLEGRTPKETRPQGWSVVVEALCILDGFDAPVVWRSKRVKSSMAIVADILPTYRKEILEAIKKEKGKRPPLWSFWLPIRGARDAKNEPVYEKTKGKPVTPPKLILPDMQGRDLWNHLYVGKELLQWGEEMRGYYDDWLKTPLSASFAPVAATANTPQEYDPSESFDDQY